MNTIKFNQREYEVFSFIKNTYFNGDSVNSSSSCSIRTSDITSLHAMAHETIETLQIYHDEELIYSLNNLHGKLTSIDETLMDSRININLNFDFSHTVEPAEDEDEEDNG